MVGIVVAAVIICLLSHGPSDDTLVSVVVRSGSSGGATSVVAVPGGVTLNLSHIKRYILLSVALAAAAAP